MFQIEPVQLQFSLDEPIADLQTKNDVLMLACGHVLYRIDLKNPETVNKLVLLEGIDKVFLDTTGVHLVVISKEGTVSYIHGEDTQAQLLTKLKGLGVTCVEFSPKEYVELNNTGSVLIGTLSGTVYEVIIDSNTGFNSRLDKVVRQVYKLDAPIVGIHMESPVEGSFNVQIATQHQTLIFEHYQVPKYHHKSSNFHQLHKTALVSFKMNNKLCTYFGSKLCCVELNDNVTLFSSEGSPSSQFNDSDGKKVSGYKLESHDTSNFDARDEEGSAKSNFKIKDLEDVESVLLSQFHVFVLLKSKILCYNQLSSELVSEYLLPQGQNFKKLTLDPILKTFWLYSESELYELLIENESKDIWQIMLAQNLFNEALQVIDANDLNSRDLILIKKAESFYKQGNPELAKIFSKTSKPTEEVMLLFKDDLTSSLTYLMGKLLMLPKPQVMQRITLSSWIVELYMELFNQIEMKINSFNTSSILNNSQEPHSDLDNSKLKELKLELQSKSKEFEKFLNVNSSSLHKQTVYQIILSHNRKQELLFFANLVKDYDFVLNYYINLGKWSDLLKILLLLFDTSSSPNHQDNLEYIYKYASVLMMNEPKETVRTWLRINDYTALDFVKLLPAMTTYNKIVCNVIDPKDNEALNLLQHLITNKKNNEKLIHNTYLCLLLSYPFGDGETQILRYLEKSVAGGGLNSMATSVLFDTDFVLRLCNKYNKIRSLIYIHSISGDYEEAVHLALQNDLIELATVIADKPAKRDDYSFVQEENDEGNRLRKKLWLSIAAKLINEVMQNDKYLTQNQDNIAVEDRTPININEKNPNISKILKYILNKANTGDLKLLTIQDLLPLFPDFMVIDNFKEEIVTTLENYSLDLSSLNDEMNKALTTSVKLKLEMDHFKKTRFLMVEPKDSCSICDKLLITRKFFTYPCFHSFHQDCLVNCYKTSKNYKVKNKLYILEKKLINYKKLNDTKGLNETKLEIDNTLTERCVYCDLKISELDDSFEDAEDDDF